MAVIELAKPGQEATTYELIVTVGNAALTLNGIIATQLLTPLNAVGCLDDDGCPSDTVNLNDEQSYRDSAGPKRFTNYAIVLFCISVTACFIFTQYLPRSKIECYEWKMKGEELGTSRKRGYLTLFLATVTIAVSIQLVNS